MNSQKKVSFLKKPGRPLEVNICAIPDWEGFDKLIKFLEIEYSAEILGRADGPDARRWFLKVSGQEFELRHDDLYGNYLFASTKSGEPIVEEIGLDLERRLANL